MTNDQDPFTMPNDPANPDAWTDAAPTGAELDLESLESHLDGELPAEQTAVLIARLAVDAELAATLDGLRAGRAVRRAALLSLEPDAIRVDRFAWRIRGAVAAERNRPAAVTPRPSRWGSFRPDVWHLARVGGAAAACVAFGFLGGRIGRGPGPGASVAVSPPSIIAPVTIAPTSVASTGVDEAITDEYGRVVDHQHFDSAEKARRFDEDLRRAYDGSTSAPVEGQARLASELRY